MNAIASKCSVLTLAETAGLRRSLDEKLSGPRGDFWFKAMKRLDRKENPWIPFEKVLGNLCGQEKIPFESCLTILQMDMGMNFFTGVSDYFLDSGRKNDGPSFGVDDGYDIVSVRLGDLLTCEEMLHFTYEEMLEKAYEEYGFGKCKPCEGLVAATNLALVIMNTKHMFVQGIEHVIATDVIRREGDTMSRLPAVYVWCGKRKEQGMVNFLGIKTSDGAGSSLSEANNPLANAETRFLFRSDHL